MAIYRESYSYTRLAQYKSCPFAYDLKYNQKKFCEPPALTLFLGTLVHHIEEKISRALMAGKKPDYNALLEEFYEIDIPKQGPFDRGGDIFGVNVLKDRFPQEFFTPSDKTGLSYLAKTEMYAQNIKRQERFLEAHPELELWDVEHPFEIEFEGEKLRGYIDRVLKYKGEDRYQIQDIKTRDRPYEGSDVTTPLQHIVYALALQKELGLKEPPTECFFDLPFCDQYQEVGTKGFIARGVKQLEKIFGGIHTEEYPPKPSPLCYWCPYSNTNPKVTTQGESSCPYYSLWTPENPNYEVLNKYESPAQTKELIRRLKEAMKEREAFVHANDFANFEF